MGLTSRSRRLAAALTVVAAVLVLVAPVAVSSAATTPTIVRITVVKGRPVGGIPRPTVNRGAVVRFVVRVDRGRELHLHGYDVDRAVVPGKPTVLQVVARIPGRFELELHAPDAVIARLTVRP